MKKLVLVFISVVFYLLTITLRIQIDYSAWITVGIIDTLFELYLYTQKPTVTNEDAVSFHSRNLLGNTIWRSMLAPEKVLLSA